MSKMISTWHSVPCSKVGNMSKDQIALNDISFNITSFLQSIMRNTSFEFNDTEVFSPNFLSFLHITLLYLVEILLSLRSISLQETSEEEQSSINELYHHKLPSKIDLKMNEAIKLMKIDLPQKIKQSMLQAGFENSETENNHNAKASLVSTVIIYEADKFMRYKERFKYSVNNQTLRNKSELSMQRQRTPASECKTKVPANLYHNEEEQHSTPPSMKLIASTRKHNVYHIFPENVAMKVLKSNHPQLKDVKNLDYEFEFGNSCIHLSIRPSLRRLIFERKQALVLEWAPGVPLSHIKKSSVKKFLIIAREIVSSLLTIHMKHMMHLNLSCEHIIFDAESSSIKIISCGSCTTLRSNKSYISKQELLEKDLRCISPEQTGRVNRDTDYRTDFYSLGIIFYRLLAGNYPFESANALQLVQMHAFQDPLSVCSIDPNIPKVLSNMISILLEKNAENRYQSTKGIIHDLDLMISEYNIDETLSSIELVQHDIPETLIIPQKQYGHSTHYNALLSVFDRVTRSFEAVFVSGDSGTGKSFLVFELYGPITQRNGVFMSGKYDFSKSEPYSALLEAVNNFCEDLLVKDETTILNCKSQIQNAVGEEGKILTDVITNLHLVIGEQPCASDAFGLDAKNRFIYVFIKFIKAICSNKFPIVLVLDDLQWMDVESLSLLSALVTDKTIKNLMFVGIYRDNEVSDTHPVTLLLQDLENSKITVTPIKLENLDHEAVNEVISDTLCIHTHEAYALTAMIHEKTKGNPFFVNQMLKSLYEQGSIFFSSDECKWKWDSTIFGENDISENVMELLRSKILALDEHTQQALKVASCLGSSFSLLTLKLVLNRYQAIEGALSTGMITQQNGSDTMYRFVHDQIQLAAFSLLPKDPKEIFLHIGKKLWKLFSKQELHENIYVVIHLLHNAIDIIRNQEERSEVAALYLEAGNRAITSTAFRQAFKYLETGINLLGPDDCWKSQYELCLKLHDAAAKAAYCASNYDSFDSYKDAILKNAQKPLHTVQAYSLQIRFYNDNFKFQDALDTAVCILNKIGESINLKQNEILFDFEVIKAKNQLHGKIDEDISEMKTEKDEGRLAVMTILSDILSSLHYLNPQLSSLVSARMVNLTLEYGISKFSTLGFSALGSYLCSKGDRMGHQLGNLSLILLKKVYAKEFVPWVYGSFYGQINPFYASIHESITPYLDIYKVSLEVGSYLGTAIAASTYCSYAFLSGKNLEKLKDDIDDLEEVFPTKPISYISIHQAVLNLLGTDCQNPAILSGPIFDCKSCYDIDSKEKKCWVARSLVYCAMIAYLFQDYSSALIFVERFRPIKNYILTVYHYPIMVFYEGLISLAFARTETDKGKWIGIAEESITKLRDMSENAPENCLNKVFLLEAELAMLRGNEAKVKACFKKAISLSNKHNFPHEEALSCEREGLFFLENDSLEEAQMSLCRSYNCYEKWGAKAKLRHLTETYPAFKFSPCEVNYSNLEVNHDSEFSVSILTEASFTSTINSKRKRVIFNI